MSSVQQVPHQNVDQLGMGFKGRSFDLIDFRPPAHRLQVRRVHAAVGL